METPEQTAAPVEEASMEQVMAGEQAKAPEQPEQATQQPAESAPAQDDTPAEPDGVQKRINKITAEKYAEKRRADELEQRLQALESDQQKPQAAAPAAEPKAEDFETDADYHAALIEHQISQRLSAQEAQQQQAQEQQRKQQVTQGFNAKVAEFAEAKPDYVETVGQLPQLQPETLETVMTMENGPEVAYYLGKHLDVADEIASASPMVAAMRLGEIRARLVNADKPNAQPSAAPAPVETLSGGGSGGSKDLDEMSMEEIMAL